MVCGLFSSFDPVLWNGSMGWKWVCGMVVVLGMFWQVFSLSSGFELVKSKGSSVVGEMIQKTGMKVNKVLMVVWSLFVTILLLNIAGLVPYSLSLTSHLCINLSFSIPLWGMGVMLFMWETSDKFFSHFLPTGSPSMLWLFLVIVESVSWLIRPGTLGIRLMANIMAGHLITSLLGEMLSKVSIGFVCLPMYSGLMSYEVGVCVIQAYVFTSLIILYSSESE